MCMEDVTLGRELATETLVVQPTNGVWVLLVGKDPNRTRIQIGGTNISNGFIQFAEAQPNAATQVGFYVNPQAGNFTATVEEYGKTIQSNVWVLTTQLADFYYVNVCTLVRQK